MSRLVCAGVIVAASSWPFDGGLKFRGFQMWDGVWYTAIARDGYGVLPVGGLQTRWPFFPLLPGIMRGFGEIGLGDQAVTVILNELVLLVAFAGVYRIATRHASAEASVLAVWALALFPASFLFSMIYPSAIFLAATVWAFVLVEDRHDVAAAAVVAVAAIASAQRDPARARDRGRAPLVEADRARLRTGRRGGGGMVRMALGPHRRPDRLLEREVRRGPRCRSSTC